MLAGPLGGDPVEFLHLGLLALGHEGEHRTGDEAVRETAAGGGGRLAELLQEAVGGHGQYSLRDDT